MDSEKLIKKHGSNIWIHPQAIIGNNFVIGHASCLGYGEVINQPVSIGDDVSIGAFCVIHNDTVICNNVEIDHYCRVSVGSQIGANTKILYGVQIFDDVVIGENCIIGGDLIDRVIVEDNVTYMGHMAHTYRHPGTIQDWDTMVQPSPIIKANSVVGERALILGGVEIGPESYIAAGEIIRSNIPPKTVVFKGKMTSLDAWRGFVAVRG